MYFERDEIDDEFDEIIYEDEEEDENAMYFDVDLPLRPNLYEPKMFRWKI